MGDRKEEEDSMAGGSHVECASRYRRLTQRDGVREEGWVVQGAVESPQNGALKNKNKKRKKCF